MSLRSAVKKLLSLLRTGKQRKLKVYVGACPGFAVSGVQSVKTWIEAQTDQGNLVLKDEVIFDDAGHWLAPQAWPHQPNNNDD